MQVGDLSRRGWKEVTGINSTSSGDYYGSGYGQMGSDSYQQQSPGERSSLVNGYNRDDDWSCTSQQGSKYEFCNWQRKGASVIIFFYRASSPKSPNQNWDSSWGYQSGSYQSDSRDFISSEATSPVSNNQKQSGSKKEKKTKEEKKATWDSKWGDDELWESLNK